MASGEERKPGVSEQESRNKNKGSRERVYREERRERDESGVFPGSLLVVLEGSSRRKPLSLEQG